MKVALYGPPASGKTTIGQRLAAVMGVPFVDTDAVVEGRAGMPIPDIFARDGEAGFRALESEVCCALAEGAGSMVMALGGGSLLDSGVRLAVERRAAVVCLAATQGQLARRLPHEGSRPLLAGGDPQGELARLLDARRPHYASFPAVVDTTERTVDESAAAAADLVQPRALHLKAPGFAHEIALGYGSLDRLEDLLDERGLAGPLVVVTDENVHLALGSRLPPGVPLIVLPPGEEQKCLSSAERLCGQLARTGIDRSGTLVAVGGGVIGDLAGFCAAVFMRGIRWVNVPTTLLAMVDAGVGGKTAVNLREGKNLAGRFHAPALVVIDPLALATLPPREYRSGMAEVIKHAVVSDPALFTRIEAATAFGSLPDLDAALSVKLRFVQRDPQEENVRAVLNFGHTIGHAVEASSGYALTHGEAVAIGMVAEARLAERLSIAERGTAARIRRVLQMHGLPDAFPGLDAVSLLELARVDKKKAGAKLRLSLPERIGRGVHGIEIDDDALREALESIDGRV